MNGQGIKQNRIASCKPIGVVLLVLSVFGFLIFTHRLSYYVFEYDPQYSPIDYGRVNIFFYFTVQSNFLSYVYLFFAGLGIFGVKKAQKIGFNETLGALVTVYVLVAGITYCAGIPMGLTPPFKWDTPTHAMSSFIQVYYHMIMPVVVSALWLFPFTNRKLTKKCAVISGIYPLVYSVFSMVRGRISSPTYYPYPFYNPEFIWQSFMADKPINMTAAYLIIVALLAVGISLFVGITALIVLIHNKRTSA